ncbi:MAG TPA: hypothetical protein VFI39_06775 [Gemmatimonadales bacterium]|nr:hypothetical protein [Gemmatimonadales bacterium]
MEYSSSRRILFSSVVAATLTLAALACVRPHDRLSATMSGAAFHAQVIGPAQASTCHSRGVLVLQGSQGDDGLALVWFYGDSLRTDSVPLGPPVWRRPGAIDSMRSVASGAYRRTTATDVLGYQSRTGRMWVTPGPDGDLSATFAAVFDRTGTAESLWVTGRFDGLRPVEDSTLCGIPRATPDSGVTLTP